jgi:hypothetical protein
MDLTKLSDASDQLDEKNKKAILDVINLKVEDDMKDVLTKMDSMFARFETRFEHMEGKFAQIDSKFTHVEDKISTLYWVVGLSTALIAIFIALK